MNMKRLIAVIAAGYAFYQALIELFGVGDNDEVYQRLRESRMPLTPEQARRVLDMLDEEGVNAETPEHRRPE